MTGGTADFEKSVTGGTATIDGGKLEFDGKADVDVTFASGHYGELVLGDVKHFSGTISGFGGTDSDSPSLSTSDEIDVLGCGMGDIHFSEDDHGNAIVTVTQSDIRPSRHSPSTISTMAICKRRRTGMAGRSFTTRRRPSSTSPSVSIGGAGNDTFVFHPGEGAQTVNNFDPQQDTIELDHFANIHNVPAAGGS